jgi:hypothetical protein
MKTLFSKAFEMLLNLGRALKPHDLQKEVDELKQSTKETKEKVATNTAKLKQMRWQALERSIGYSHADYDSNLN